MIQIQRVRLERELARWREAGLSPRLWWRDDDAREPTPALDRLLRVADGVPLALAIVPDGDLAGLGRALGPVSNVTISQHGVDHVNRRGPGEAMGEHPLGASAAVMAQRISAGRAQMEAHGLTPAFYTPPWNRLDDHLMDALAASGSGGLSGWGGFQGLEGRCRRLDAHIDLLRWKPRPRFRGDAAFLRALQRELARRRRTRRFHDPIGLLTHHLDHDEGAWRFLGELVDFTRDRFEWVAFDGAAAKDPQQPNRRVMGPAPAEAATAVSSPHQANHAGVRIPAASAGTGSR